MYSQYEYQKVWFSYSITCTLLYFSILVNNANIYSTNSHITFLKPINNNWGKKIVYISSDTTEKKRCFIVSLQNR